MIPYNSPFKVSMKIQNVPQSLRYENVPQYPEILFFSRSASKGPSLGTSSSNHLV